jgi:hypothetical protein
LLVQSDCMTRLAFVILVLLAGLIPAGAAPVTGPRDIPAVFAPFAQVETHRIRLLNVEDGPIQISTDHGVTWQLIGRVTAPATESLPGYLASGYAPPGTVAATAIHGIRIRVGNLTTAYPKLINILPREFATTLQTFGGHISGASGIYTNIHTGTSIFRDLSPYVGNRVYLDADDQTPLKIGYVPHVGDTLTIIVKRPANPLTQVVFQNKTGGDVTATYADGTTQVITHVVKPVLGTGRFDGTSYTGVGALNTNHCGVITVSTAPVSTSTLLEGTGPERRGGFQIEPAYHNSQSTEAGAPMILDVGIPGHKFQMDQEGKPPLFFGYFNLAWDPQDTQHSWVAELQYGDKTPWKPMIESIGLHPDSLKGVTAIRLTCAATSDEPWLVAQAQNAEQHYRDNAEQWAVAGKTPLQRGEITIKASDRGKSVSVVAFYVDGIMKGMTNQMPFEFTWNTATSPDGEYTIEARSEDASGDVLSSTSHMVWIDNTGQIEKERSRSAQATVPGISK